MTILEEINSKNMTIIEFAKKYIPYQKGHSEDMEFLNDLIIMLNNTLDNHSDNEIFKELAEYTKHIKQNPNK